MSDQSIRRWCRGGALTLALAWGFVLIPTQAVISDEEKPAAKAKADETPKADNKPKSDEKPEEPKPEPTVPAPSGGSPNTTLINVELAKFWAANNVRPARKATDYEFVRRVYLDVLGRIPAAWEVRDYANDPNRSTKRSRLIQKLLHDEYYREEYEDHWADVWTTALLTRTANRINREQMHEWLMTKFGRNAAWDQIVRELITATGENNDNGAVNYILTHVGEQQNDRGNEGQFDFVPVTSRTVRLFLGVQIQCAQCHHHPFNPDWKQHHFWGVNAFFRQTEREGTPLMRQNNNMPNMAAKLALKDNTSYNSRGTVFFEDRQAVMFESGPKFLDGKKIPAGAKATRRELLADYVIEHDMFAKAFVNRMWAHFFGRGLNQNAAFDDFGEHNQVVHQELLEGLAKSFREYKFNIKELMAWILNSEAYNLSVEANGTNNKPEHEVYFSRMLLKTMGPEQLYESLRVALDQPIKPKAGGAPPPKAKPKVEATRGRRNAREDWLTKLTTNFGDDEGNELTFNGTVVQALLMMNGNELQREITRKENNTVMNALVKGKTPAGILNELTMAALARPATQAEITLINREGRLTGANAQWFWEDVLWALLNSNEFILNH